MPHNSPMKFAMRCSLLALLLFIAASSCNAFASTDTIRYDYDNSYQVRKAAFGNTSTTYSYDPAGNRDTKNTFKAGSGTNHAPNTPANPVTVQGGMNVLGWTGGDPDAGDSVTYDLYIGTSQSNMAVVYSGPLTGYYPTLQSLTQYYWKVVATDGYNVTTTGPTWSFMSFGLADTDGDGVPDNRDNSPTVSNPTQVDTDGDGIGDASDDCPTIPITAIITTLANGATISGHSFTITGTAGGGMDSCLTEVEVSTNGGATYATATGKGSWSYVWTLPTTNGTYSIRYRASDTRNTEKAGPGINVTVSHPLGVVTFDKANYLGGADTAAITVVDADEDMHPGPGNDTITIKVTSTSDATGETITLNEDSSVAGRFTGQIGFEPFKLFAANGKLFVSNGDALTVTYNDALTPSGFPQTVAASALWNSGRALWLYSADDIINNTGTARADFFAFCAAPHADATRRIDTVYVDAFAAITANATFLKSFIADAHSRNIRVECLMGAPDWATASGQITAVAAIGTLTTFNDAGNADEKFDGVHLDVQPTQLASWSSDTANVWAAFISTLTACRTAVDNYNGLNANKINLAADIPADYDTAYPNITSSEAVQDKLDYVALKAMKDTSDSITTATQHELDYAATSGRKAVIGVETANITPVEATFYEEGYVVMDTRLDAVATHYQTNYAFAEFAVNDYAGYNSLGNLPSTPVSMITDLANGDTISGIQFTVTGTASCINGISLVEFYNGTGWANATDTSGNSTWASWSFLWTLPADGPYTINSKATDGNNNVEIPGAGVTVTVDNTNPRNVSASADNGVEGTAQQVQAVWSHPAGAANLSVVYLKIGSDSGVNTQIMYDNATGTISLWNDAHNGWITGATPSNSLVSVNNASSTVNASGTTFTASYNVTPSNGLVGTRALSLYATDINDNHTPAYEQKGTWTIAGAAPVNLSANAPTSFAKAAQTVMATWSDASGADNISTAYLMLSNGGTSTQVYYDNNTGLLYLQNDEGTGWIGGYAPGSANTIINTVLSINCAATTIAPSGNDFTVNFSLTPSIGLVGTQSILLYAIDKDGNNSGSYEQKATWQIQSPAPVNVSATAASVQTGYWQQADAVWYDPNGFSDLGQMSLQIGPDGGPMTKVMYDNDTGLLYLLNDAGTNWLGGYAPGSANTITNGLMVVDCAGTVVSTVGDYNRMASFRLKPLIGLAGTQPLILDAADDEGNAAAHEQKGVWAINPPAFDILVFSSEETTATGGTGSGMTQLMQVALLVMDTVHYYDESGFYYDAGYTYDAPINATATWTTAQKDIGQPMLVVVNTQLVNTANLNVPLEIRYKSNAGDPWSNWEALTSAPRTFRFFQIRANTTSTDTSVAGQISKFEIAVYSYTSN